jgi:hypothetical protein
MPKINGNTVTDAQAAVYGVLAQSALPLPDHALVPFAQHALGVKLSSSGIRTRRKELFDKGLVRECGNIRMPSGRKAKCYTTV